MTRKERAVRNLRDRVADLCDPGRWIGERPAFCESLLSAVSELDQADLEAQINDYAERHKS